MEAREKETRSLEKKKMLIPDDILIEILSRLPVKSLLRLRWTCKYWFDLLLKNPGFIKMHLHRHHSTSGGDNTSLLLISRSAPLGVVVSYSVNCSDLIINNNSSSPPPETVQFDYCNLPVWIDHHTIQANEEKPHHVQFHSLGSCNGLIFLHSLCGICYYQVVEFEYFLWNPSTREIKKLPHKKSNVVDLPCRDDSYSHFYGFGYDHTIDDYKVIDILTLYDDSLVNGGDDDDVVYPQVNINIYTLGSNSWSKKINTNQLGCFAQNKFRNLNRGCCFLNGALHWLTGSGILSFDIVEEEEQKPLQLPNYGDRGSSLLYIYCRRLEVLNGCLCVVNYFETELHSHESYVELWMMKDYGVNESWTKIFTIDSRNSGNIYCWSYLSQFKPIELCKDDGILMLINEKYLVLYDLKNEKGIWVHEIDHIEDAYFSESYIESMVSLKSGIYLTDVGSTTSVHKRIDQVVEEEEEDDEEEEE